MNRKPLFFTIVAVLIISIAAFVFRSWLEAHDYRMALQATLTSQKQLIAAADQREQQRQQDLKSTLAQIDELKRQTQTPQQIVRELPQYLHLPQPIQLIPAPALQQGSAKSAEQGTAPPGKSQAMSAPSASPSSGSVTQPGSEKLFAQIPAEDLKPLYDYIQDCRACQAQLASARADVNDERSKSAALVRERDAAIKAVKGGSFWTRIKRNVKWLAIGAGIGYVVAHAH